MANDVLIGVQRSTQSGAKGRSSLSILAPLGVLGAFFVAQALALYRNRLDYPIADDWRYYRGAGHRLPETLNLDWLLTPALDTMHATGKLFDWLILRVFAHDYTLLATLSFVLFFGGWLLATIAFCFTATRGNRPVLWICLSVFLLCLAGAPYWVTLSPHQYLEPAIAYHQMLPILGLSLLAQICISTKEEMPGFVAPVTACLVTAIFAMTYSSGALLLLVFGLTLLLLALHTRSVAPQIQSGLPYLALAISGTAALCLAAHILAPMERFDLNPALQSRNPLPYIAPWNGDFWRFFFALFDRSVLSTALDWPAQLRGISIAAIVALPAIGLSWGLVRNHVDPENRRVVTIVVAILVSIIGYAALISYGRAGYGKHYFPEVLESAARISLYAHCRFFYWWITAVLPISIIAWWLWLGGSFRARTVIRVVALLALWMLLPKPQQSGAYGDYLHHWNFTALYQRDAEEVARLIHRDVMRTKGEVAHTPRYLSWRALDQETRNPAYWLALPGAEHNGIPKKVYRRAQQRRATFIERWGLLAEP